MSSRRCSSSRGSSSLGSASIAALVIRHHSSRSTSRSAHHRTTTVREPRDACRRAGRSPTEMSSNRRSGQPDSRSTRQRDGSGRSSAARLDGMTADTLVLPTVAPSTPLPRCPRLVPPARRRHRLRAGRLPARHRSPSSSSSPASRSGAGLLVIWVGVAVLPRALLAARAFATAERAWLPAVLRRPLPRPAYLPRRGPAGAPAGRRRCAIRRPGWTRCTRSSASRWRSSPSSSP